MAAWLSGHPITTMITLTTIILFLNAVMLMLALSALLVLTIFLQDDNQQQSRHLALFIVALIIWSMGSFITRTTAQVATNLDLTAAGVTVIEIGFGAVCVSAFFLASSLAHITSPTVRFAAWVSALVAVAYRFILFALDVNLDFEIHSNGTVDYRLPTINRWVYFGFAAATITIAWRNASKFRRNYLGWAFLVMGVGQLAAVLSPRLRMLGVAEITTSLSTLFIAYGIVQTEVVDPFLQQKRQVTIVQEVGVAVTNLGVDKVLEAIAKRAALLLDARGGAVYLYEDGRVLLSAVYNLPDVHVGTLQIDMGQGTVGEIALERRPIRLNNYWHEMHGKPHEGFPIEAIGALAGVPLLLGAEVVGVLIVAEGRDKNVFATEQVERLKLIAPQAAVTIRNNRLLEDERRLKQQLRTQQTQLQTVLTSTSNPVLAVGRDLRIIFINPAAQELLGVAASPDFKITGYNLLGLVDSTLLPPDMRSALRIIRRDGAYVYEISHNRQDYLCHITPLSTSLDKRIRGWVIVLNNVTSLKEVDRLQSQMIRVTTHDLKNPLFALQMYLENIEADTQHAFDDQTQRNMEIVWTQIQRMERIITGILNLERLQQSLAFQTIDLNDTLASAVYGVEGLAHSKQLELSLNIDSELPASVGDSQQLLQAITNLLDNAIKFTPSGGKIEVRARATESEIIIEIEDTGIGIPEDAQSQVFERFFRVARGRTSTDAGSGLGLSLVHAIIEQHQGQIDLKSYENQGTTFTIRLPIVNEVALSTS